MVFPFGARLILPFDAGMSNIIQAVNWTAEQANRVAVYFGFGAHPQVAPPVGLFSSFKEYLHSVILRLFHGLMYLLHGAFYSVTYLGAQIITVSLADPKLTYDTDPTALVKPTSSTYREMVRVMQQQLKQIPPKAMLYALAVVMTLIVFAIWKIDKLAHRRGYKLEHSEVNENTENDSASQTDNSDLHEFSDVEADGDRIHLESVGQTESEVEKLERQVEVEECAGEPKEETENKSQFKKSEAKSKLPTPLAATVRNPPADYKNWFLDSLTDIPSDGPGALGEPPKKHLKNLKKT